jgi:hypothetical protein
MPRGVESAELDERIAHKQTDACNYTDKEQASEDKPLIECQHFAGKQVKVAWPIFRLLMSGWQSKSYTD